jgi:uncharacterized protein (DUF305 family)
MMRHHTLRRALLAGAAALSAVLVAAGCGSSGDMGGMPGMGTSASPTASGKLPTGVNDADVMFAQMMIPHHQQAVTMATLATTRASDPQLKTLAAQIKAAQDPEITTMTGWLTSWGRPTAAPSASAMPGMDTSVPTPGMMSDADMAKLSAATGTNFDRMFAQMMISHHNGAIQMAGDEQKNGTNTNAKTLAAQIIKSQQAEVTTLEKILNRL